MSNFDVHATFNPAAEYNGMFHAFPGAEKARQEHMERIVPQEFRQRVTYTHHAPLPGLPNGGLAWIYSPAQTEGEA